jgi:hypothetical protein
LLCQTSQDLPVAFISNARHLEILNPCRQMTDQGQTLSEAGQYCHGSHLSCSECTSDTKLLPNKKWQATEKHGIIKPKKCCKG